MTDMLKLDPAILARAEAQAAREGRTVEQLIFEALDRVLDTQPATSDNEAGPHAHPAAPRSGWLYEDRDGRPLPFPVFYGGKPGESGIDWTSNASIYATLYEEEDERIRRWSTGESPDL